MIMVGLIFILLTLPSITHHLQSLIEQAFELVNRVV